VLLLPEWRALSLLVFLPLQQRARVLTNLCSYEFHAELLLTGHGMACSTEGTAVLLEVKASRYRETEQHLTSALIRVLSAAVVHVAEMNRPELCRTHRWGNLSKSVC